MNITDYQPKLVWKHFHNITQIPRPSKHEEKIREHLVSFASSRGLTHKTDGVGNLVIQVPASPGKEGAPTVVLQSHMDMVCEKNNDVSFDFMTQPLKLKIAGDWLMAEGTTLGADNGVGLAASLALVDDPDLVHGPLEILITVDEETGLTGAADLAADMLTGRILLNLDTEELDALYIGCSGGGDTRSFIPVTRESIAADAAVARVVVKGLKGGHSGLDISEQRGNAIRILARLLSMGNERSLMQVVELSGGGKHNAIPREAHAMVAVPDLDEFMAAVKREAELIKPELGKADPGLDVQVAAAAGTSGDALNPESTLRVVASLLAIPHGVDAMSLDVPGLVETSNNLAAVDLDDDQVSVLTSTRSSIGSALEALRDRIVAVTHLAGGTAERSRPYPGWKPDLDSKVLAVTAETHETLFGKAPELKAVHAGLECGIIGEKYPGMDMVSFGPLIEMPHSPDERVEIPSVETFWKLLRAVVERLAD